MLEQFNNKKIEFIPVLEKDVETFDNQIIKKYGLDELIIKTINKLKNSISPKTFIYVNNQVINTINKELKEIKIKKDFTKIKEPYHNYFSKLINLLDEKSIKLIDYSIDNLLLSCKSEIDFNNEISKYISDFRNKLKINNNGYYGNNENQLSQNDIKNILTDIEKELIIRYDKINIEYIKNHIQ